MTTHIKMSAVTAISNYLVSIVDDSGYDEFHTWLFDHYPHIRVQAIGDEPMCWFSISRCNPPSDQDLSETQAAVRFLNEVVMVCSLEVYTDEIDELFSMRCSLVL